MDIDKLLVVTFTNAAASEMRERILEAIYKKIEENPTDMHLQRQITLLNKASICTIHSFCLDVIRNYFYEIDTSANFRIGETAEIELLKQDVLEDIFEEKYAKQEESFLDLIDTYTTYREDDSLKDLILKIEQYIQSNPFPDQWLEEKVEMFHVKEKLEQDFSNTIWGRLLLEDLLEQVKENRNKLESVRKKMQRYPELEKYINTIEKDIQELEEIEKVICLEDKNKWDKVVSSLENIKFEKWPIDRKANIEYKEEAKSIRDKVKKDMANNVQKRFMLSSKQANKDIAAMYPRLVALKNLILTFEERFSEKKKEKNIIDFHDIEYFALNILIKQNEEGKVIPTQVAKNISEKYEEIAIDEYQDSNLVQEYILTSISRGSNIFMVGDVKQSIYKFRQAMPELFLEKYENYSFVEEKEEKLDKGRKIKLFKNFRSRENILQITNIMFEEIMSKKLGDIDYNKQEYLNLGANYLKPEDKNIQNYAGKAELLVVDLKQEEQEEEGNQEDVIEKTVLEAKLVVQKIQELIHSNYMVYDKGNYRKMTYRDIVILLRSTANVAPIYEKEMIEASLPVFCDTTAQYLDSTEIQTILSVLKIVDNPMQDIPLICVLRSPIGNFTDNDLVEIRLQDRTSHFYIAMQKARTGAKEELRTKIDHFFERLEHWKKSVKQKALDELIWQIYTETNYYYYVRFTYEWKTKTSQFKNVI